MIKVYTDKSYLCLEIDGKVTARRYVPAGASINELASADVMIVKALLDSGYDKLYTFKIGHSYVFDFARYHSSYECGKDSAEKISRLAKLHGKPVNVLSEKLGEVCGFEVEPEHTIECEKDLLNTHILFTEFAPDGFDVYRVYKVRNGVLFDNVGCVHPTSGMFNDHESLFMYFGSKNLKIVEV